MLHREGSLVQTHHPRMLCHTSRPSKLFFVLALNPYAKLEVAGAKFHDCKRSFRMTSGDLDFGKHKSRFLDWPSFSAHPYSSIHAFVIMSLVVQVSLLPCNERKRFHVLCSFWKMPVVLLTLTCAVSLQNILLKLPSCNKFRFAISQLIISCQATKLPNPTSIPQLVVWDMEVTVTLLSCVQRRVILSYWSHSRNGVSSEEEDFVGTLTSAQLLE